MGHTHCWKVTLYVLLSLPDRNAMADRVVRWDCPCGVYLSVDGNFKIGTPLMTPEYWDHIRRQEQRAGTPEAQMARQQQGARRPRKRA